MKNYIVVLSLILSVSVLAEEPNGKQFSGSRTNAITSQYLDKLGIVIHEEPQLETQLTLAWGDEVSAWYTGFWTSGALDKRGGDFDDEIDIWVGYQRYLEQFTFDGTLSYFAFEQFDETEFDQWVVDLRLTMEQVPIVKPHFQLRYFGEVGNESPEGGFFAFAGLSRSQPLGFTLPWAENKQTLELGTEALWSIGALDKDKGYVGTKFFVATNIQTSKNSRLTPAIIFQLSAGDQNGGPRDHVDGNQWVFGLTWGLKF